LAAAPSSLGAPLKIHNLANGTDAFDAVNKSQLDAMYQASYNQNQATRDEAFRGIAISNAMEVFLPDPGRKFRLNFGMGFYKDEAALGLTGSGRFGEDVGLYFGVGSDASFDDVGGKAGVSFQW
jgi:autotransporter adhesin